MRHFILIAIAAAPLLGGCYTSGEYFRKKGLTRASFEMNCPPEKLQVIELNGESLQFGSQVGVSGCDKKIVYVMTQAGWIANSASDAK